MSLLWLLSLKMSYTNLPFNKINVKAKQCRTAISCAKFRRNSFFWFFSNSNWGIDKFTYFTALIFLLTVQGVCGAGSFAASATNPLFDVYTLIRRCIINDEK